MIRDVEALARGQYDIVVVGGGVYGAAVLRSAALRGLSAALVEQNDFGSGTSANSLKILHGGLRYLQQADLPRLRESVRERRAWLRIAPHLAEPLSCLMPTRGCGMHSRAALAAGIAMNECLSLDRNRGIDPLRRIPAGRMLARPRTLAILPGIAPATVTAGAAWHDAIAYDSERLVLGLVQDAVRSGAAAANYVRATSLMTEGRRVTGIHAHDVATGRDLAIAGRVVINCAGPWTDEWLQAAPIRLTRPRPGLALAMNVVLRRSCVADYAAGLRGDTGRLLFFVPWRGITMVGTQNRWHADTVGNWQVGESALDDFLREVNTAYPGIRLSRGDLADVLAGLLPSRAPVRPGGEPRLDRHFTLIDHARHDETDGLITLLGVKYTTARDVAERAVAMAARKLGRRCPPSGSERRPLPGGDIPDLDAFLRDAARSIPASVPDAARDHLLRNYGSDYRKVLALVAGDPTLAAPLGASSTLGAAIAYAVRKEMALTLSDILFRRTGLGTVGRPDQTAMNAAAALAARELGWSPDRTRREQEAASARWRHIT